jgi:hypothetical protein
MRAHRLRAAVPPGFFVQGGSSSQTSLSGNFTFNATVLLGPSVANRYILFLTYASSSTANSLNFTSVTLDGVAATRLVQHNMDFNHAAYWLIAAPPGIGTAATWSGSYSGGATSTRGHLTVWRLYSTTGNAPALAANGSAFSAVVGTTISASLTGLRQHDLIIGAFGTNAGGSMSVAPSPPLTATTNLLFATNTRRRGHFVGRAPGMTASPAPAYTLTGTFDTSAEQANISAIALRFS